MRTFLGVLIALAPLVAGGQGNIATSTATAEGDVYLVMANGDIKKAAANTVTIVRDNASTRRALEQACSNFRHEVPASVVLRAQLDSAKADSIGKTVILRVQPTEANRDAQAASSAGLATVRAKVARHGLLVDSVNAAADKVLNQNRAGSSPTGMEAHYRIAGLAPGSYFLMAETRILTTSHRWLRPVRLVAGNNKADLDNDWTITEPFCVR